MSTEFQIGVGVTGRCVWKGRYLFEIFPHSVQLFFRSGQLHGFDMVFDCFKIALIFPFSAVIVQSSISMRLTSVYGLAAASGVRSKPCFIVSPFSVGQKIYAHGM